MTEQDVIDLINRATAVASQRAVRRAVTPRFLVGTVSGVDVSSPGIHDVILDGDTDTVAAMDVSDMPLRVGTRVATIATPPHQLWIIGKFGDTQAVPRQVLESNSSAFSGTVNTDFVLTSIPMRDTRLYKVCLHSSWDVTAAMTDLIVLTEDGTQIATFDVTDGDRDIIDAAVLIEPTKGLHTYRIRLIEAVGGGTITFEASSTSPRQFWIEEIGPR